MTVVRYGSAGEPVVYLPSSGGDHEEFERYGMPAVCAPWVETGRLQFFAADARGPQTLFDPALPAERRMAEYARAERYLKDELLPWLGAETAGRPLCLVGASYGAFVAANLWLKRWNRVRLVCGLGGVYEMWHRLDGHHDDDVYFHTPFEYLPRLDDPAILSGIRATSGIVLYAAAADPWLAQTHRFAEILRQKELPHRVEQWPAPAVHHESVWRDQLRDFLTRTWPG
jgi:esterase/lipase superfamily enzyme